MALVGTVVGVLAVVVYIAGRQRYVNPVAGVAVYTLIGYGLGAAIDWMSRRR